MRFKRSWKFTLEAFHFFRNLLSMSLWWTWLLFCRSLPRWACIDRPVLLLQLPRTASQCAEINTKINIKKHSQKTHRRKFRNGIKKQNEISDSEVPHKTLGRSIPGIKSNTNNGRLQRWCIYCMFIWDRSTRGAHKINTINNITHKIHCRTRWHWFLQWDFGHERTFRGRQFWFWFIRPNIFYESFASHVMNIL